jgi:hypothetical protein
MQERRKEQRKTLMAYTQVFNLYGGYLLGYLADLHLQGAMVIASKAIEDQLDLTLAIELPDLPDIKASRMTVPARAVWCKEDISPEFFNIGFEFKELPADQKKVIQAIMDNYEFRRDMPNYPPSPPITRK